MSGRAKRRLVPWSMALVGALGLMGCGAPDAAPDGPRGKMIAAAAAEHGVPFDLMLALADIEGGLDLPILREVHPDELVLVAGVLELRHGRFDSLRRGAELSGRGELELAADLQLGTQAGAMVLDDLAREHRIRRERLEEWAPVIEHLSGHASGAQREEYRARVFARLRRGGLVVADGETMVLPEHDEVPFMLTVAPPMPQPLDEPDYAGAIWLETSCAGKCNTSRSADVSMIAIHDTEGDWDASVATLQNDPGKSCHYIIDADGSRLGQFIPESFNGWHVGNSHFNNRMIGIEHVGVASKDEYQTALYEVSGKLVNDIATRYGLPIDRNTVVAHQEVPDGVNIPESSPPCPDRPDQCIDSGLYGGAGHHHDPGIYWEWCQFMELAGGSCKCTDTWSLWNCVHDLSMMNRCVDGVVEIVHCADTCVVEEIGTDDHCTPLSATSGAGGGNGSGGSTASDGSGATGPAGVGGSGAASSSANAEDDGNAPVEGSCACRTTGRSSGDRSGAAALLALAVGVLARRRKRRG